MNKHLEAVGMAICFAIALAGAGFAAFGMAGVAASNSDRQAQRDRYIADNCKVVGFYGRSGEYKTYNCNGWLRRESDI